MSGLDYDGVDDVVNHGDIAAIDGATSLSVSFWLKLDAIVQQAGVIFKGALGTNVGLLIAPSHVATADQMAFWTSRTAGDGGQGTIPTTGRWQHWGWVFDGSLSGNSNRLKAWLNGAAETLAFTGTVPASIPDTGATSVLTGEGNIGSTTFQNGKTALLKVWTAALSEMEIRQEMQSYRPIRRRNLILWPDGARARDYSGNNNHGTVTGAIVSEGPPHIPRPERFIAQKMRHGGLGLWGHRILVK